MKVTIENFPSDISKVDVKKLPQGLQEEIKNTLDEQKEYGITWAEYIEASDYSFLELLVEKINKSLEKDAEPEKTPGKAKSKPKSKSKAKPKVQGDGNPWQRPRQKDSEYKEILDEVKAQSIIELSLNQGQTQHYQKSVKDKMIPESIVYIALISKNKVLRNAADFSYKQFTKDKGISSHNKELQKLILSRLKLTFFLPYWQTIPEMQKDGNVIYTLYGWNIRYNSMLKKWILTAPSGNNGEFKNFKDAIEEIVMGSLERNMIGKLTSRTINIIADKKEAEVKRLEKEVKELLKRVKVNSKLKEKIVNEVKKYLTNNGLAGKANATPLSLDAKIKILKEKKRFYSNILSGDKANFKAIGKRIGLSYRISQPKVKK